MDTQANVRRELREKLCRAIEQRADRRWAEDLVRCVPVVIDLVDQEHQRPVRELAPSIRRILTEWCLTGTGGPARNYSEADLERHLELVIREMEKVREVQLRRGEWSSQQTPPEMFG